MYNFCLFLLVGLLLNGFPHPFTGARSAHSDSSAKSQELDILEAVFRYQIEHCYSTLPDKVFFLSYTGADPSDDLINRFKADRVSIRKRSEMAGFYQDRKDQNGILLNVSGIEPKIGAVVNVKGACRIGMLEGSSSMYELVKRGNKWKVKRVRLLGIS